MIMKPLVGCLGDCLNVGMISVEKNRKLCLRLCSIGTKGAKILWEPQWPLGHMVCFGGPLTPANRSESAPTAPASVFLCTKETGR